MNFWDDIFDDRLSGSEAESDYISIPNDDTTDDSDNLDTPTPLTSTASFQSGLGKESEEGIYNKVKVVLDCMKKEGLDLPIFLDAVCWGNGKCVADPQVHFVCTTLLTSEVFPLLLHRWWRPPGARSESSRKPVQDFAVEVVTHIIESEMHIISPCMSSPEDSLSEESLTSLDLEDLSAFLYSEAGAPVIWSLLEKAGWSKKQATKNTHKTPKNVCQCYRILWIVRFY
jgi:hypothetical protein